MTRGQLSERMRLAVSRYARNIADNSTVPYSLVEELADIAEQHAAELLPTGTWTRGKLPDEPQRYGGGAENAPGKDCPRQDLPPADSAPPRKSRRTTDQTSDH